MLMLVCGSLAIPMHNYRKYYLSDCEKYGDSSKYFGRHTYLSNFAKMYRDQLDTNFVSFLQQTVRPAAHVDCMLTQLNQLHHAISSSAGAAER